MSYFKEEIKINVVFRQLLPKESFDICPQCISSTHHEGRQVSRVFLLLGTVHYQSPIFVIRVDHVRVVDTLVLNNFEQIESVKDYSADQLTNVFGVDPMRQVVKVRNRPSDISIQQFVVDIVNVAVGEVHGYLQCEREELT